MKLLENQTPSSTGTTSRCEAVATVRQLKKQSQQGRLRQQSLKLASVIEGTDPLARGLSRTAEPDGVGHDQGFIEAQPEDRVALRWRNFRGSLCTWKSPSGRPR